MTATIGNDIGTRALTLEAALERLRSGIEVAPEELQEARRRRGLVSAALRAEFASCETYVNGSVAHGDALTPLTDIDLGVIVMGEDATGFGPGLKGPSELQERAADAIRVSLKGTYENLRVETRAHKRAVLVRFGDPVTPGQDDFTADVIVALLHESGVGLHIPRHNQWDHAHPQEHTRLVLEAIRRTQVSYARVVRLVKHWARRHDRPLCSWHIKVIALDAIRAPMTLLDGLERWFTEGVEAVRNGPSEDPAGVCRPLQPAAGKTEALRKLETARSHLQAARALQDEGLSYGALDELAKVFNDETVLPPPAPDLVKADYVERLRREKAAQGSHSATATPVVATGVGVGASARRPAYRSWGEGGDPANPSVVPTVPYLLTPSAATGPPLLLSSAVALSSVDAARPCRRRPPEAQRWFGAEPGWRYPFERDARRRYGEDLLVEHDILARRLTYRLVLDVPGYIAPAHVEVVFAACPWWDLCGLTPQEYPRVFADFAERLSPHRMPDSSLCLYEPYAPPQNRWTDDEGLDALLELARTHVFAERHWRAGVARRGRLRDGEWLLPEAPHGLPRAA